MNKKNQIDSEVKKTMDLLDNQEMIPENPYFYTRVKARLDARQKQRSVFSAILKPALVAVLLAVNLGTGAWYLSGNEEDTSNEARQKLIETLAGDFNLDSNQSDLFNIE